MPSGNPGDLLVTEGAKTVLFLPEVAKPPSPFELGFHLHVEAFFKIRFPGRIVGVGLCTDLRVPLNTDRRSSQQSNHFRLPLLTFEDAGEYPTIWSLIRKVLVFHPSTWFTPVSATRPFPDRLEDGMVNGMENRKARPHDGDRVPTRVSAG